MIKINNCRYCKQQPTMRTLKWERDSTMYIIECQRCYARTYSEGLPDEAIRKWNQTFGYTHGGKNETN